MPENDEKIKNTEETEPVSILEDHTQEIITTLALQLESTRDSLVFYKEFVNWMMHESIGDIRKNLESLEDLTYMRFVGYVEVERFIRGNNIYLGFTTDEKNFTATWQPADNYAVVQWAPFEDDYHGYMLFPTYNEKKYFCMYYEC